MWGLLAKWAALTLLTIAFSPRQSVPERAATTQDDIRVNSQEGRSLKVPFGTVDKKDSAVTWYGNLRVEAIRRSGGKK